MYRVVKVFCDLKDGYHAYKVGDVFPREGSEATEARIAELSSSHNRQGTPLIEAVPEPEPKAEAEIKEEKEVVADEVEPKAEPPKKRGRKKNN